MDNNACRQLDAYLDMELSSDERQAFAEHMATCAACREAVDQQGWIDELLRSDEAAEREAAPGLLTISLPVRRRRRALVAAAAAVVAIAATLAIAMRTASTDLSPAVANVHPQAQTMPGAPAAEFVSAGSTIAIPVASDDPQVTIVQLYPTVTATRRWARDAALRTTAISPNGG